MVADLSKAFTNRVRDEAYFEQFARMQQAREVFYAKLSEATQGKIHDPKSFAAASGFGYMVTHGLRKPRPEEYAACQSTIKPLSPHINSWLKEFTAQIPAVPRHNDDWVARHHIDKTYIGSAASNKRRLWNLRTRWIEERMKDEGCSYNEAEIFVTRERIAPFEIRKNVGLKLHRLAEESLRAEGKLIPIDEAAPTVPKRWQCADKLDEMYVTGSVSTYEKLRTFREKLIERYFDPEHPEKAERLVSKRFIGFYKPKSGRAQTLYASPAAVAMMEQEGLLVRRLKLPEPPDHMHSTSEMAKLFVGSTETFTNKLEGLRTSLMKKAMEALPGDLSQKDRTQRQKEIAQDIAARYVGYYQSHSGGNNLVLYGSEEAFAILVQKGELTYLADVPPLPPPHWKSGQELKYHFRGNSESIEHKIVGLRESLIERFLPHFSGDEAAAKDHVSKHFVGEYKRLHGASTLYVSPAAVEMLITEYRLSPLATLLPPDRSRWRFLKSLPDRYHAVPAERFNALTDSLVREMIDYGMSEENAHAHAGDHLYSHVKTSNSQPLAIISPSFEREAVMAGILVPKDAFKGSNPYWQEKLAWEAGQAAIGGPHATQKERA